MPGASLFAGRDPDPTTLAGRSDAPQLPESPAAKYNPTAIASTSGAGTTGTAETQPASSTSYGYPSQTLAAPSAAGLAARANGYQTGPYGMTGASSVPATTVSNATTPTGSSSASGSFPSPYGGTYSGNTATTAPNIQLPTSVTGALAEAANSIPDYSSMPKQAAASAQQFATNAQQQVAAGTNQVAAGMQQMASSAEQTIQNAQQTATSALTAYPSIPYPNVTNYPTATAGVGASATNVSLPSYPAIPSASTVQDSAVNPPSSAYQGATTLGGYSPGTTARTTSYDFSADANNATQPASATGTPRSFTLPPNTAAGDASLLR